MSKEISFLDCPFTLERIDRETFSLESFTDLVKDTHVLIEVLAENSNVINVDFKLITDVTQHFLHAVLYLRA